MTGWEDTETPLAGASGRVEGGSGRAPVDEAVTPSGRGATAVMRGPLIVLERTEGTGTAGRATDSDEVGGQGFPPEGGFIGRVTDTFVVEVGRERGGMRPTLVVGAAEEEPVRKLAAEV